MIPQKELNEIREWLEKSQNPLFFFDNDTDGLASFLVLKRFIGRGRGIAIKSFPELSESYAKRIDELKPDVVFILDKPLVEKGFFERVREKNIPVIWIDHHLPEKTSGIYYYNPLLNEPKTNEPVSYWCYKVTKKDMWIAMTGILGDWFIPEFIDEFRKEYPDLLDSKKKAGEIIYETKFGKIIQILNFALKDKTTNVVKMLRLMGEIRSPYEIFSEEKKYESILKRFSELNKKFEKFFEKANETAKKSGKVIFFKYSGEMKLSAEIANKLIHFYPEKIVLVAYISGEKASLSLRGKKVRNYLEKALEKIEGRGGGHEVASAATIKAEDLEKFVELIKEQI